MADFAIVALTAGAGTLAMAPVPGRGGDYAGDLDRIMRWRPGLVLTMTTTAELAAVGAAPLGADLAARGVAWTQLAVADFATPGPGVAAAWPTVSAVARDVLGQQGRVLVHCYGGCGRSGMAVLRLLVEMGEAPEAALTRLRAARTCAVETAEQLSWATAVAR